MVSSAELKKQGPGYDMLSKSGPVSDAARARTVRSSTPPGEESAGDILLGDEHAESQFSDTGDELALALMDSLAEPKDSDGASANSQLAKALRSGGLANSQAPKGGFANSQDPEGDCANPQAPAEKMAGAGPKRSQGELADDRHQDDERPLKRPRPQVDINSITMTSAAFRERYTRMSAASVASGSYGNVSLHLDTQLGMMVAVKNFRSRVLVEDRRREVEQAALWRAVPHPNLVRLLAIVGPQEKPLALIYPQARESLHDRFDALLGIFTFPEACTIMAQLARALRHMHAYGVIHRDVKLANILLHSSMHSPMRVLLCDYGMARCLELAKTPRLQTQPYRAPEMQMGRQATAAMDAFSMGCVFRELLTGVLLWRQPEYERLTALEYMVLLAGPAPREELLQMAPADAKLVAAVQPLPLTAFSKRAFLPAAGVCLAGELLTWSPAARKPMVEAEASFERLSRARLRRWSRDRKVPPLTPFEAATGSAAGLAHSQSSTPAAQAERARTAAAAAGPAPPQSSTPAAQAEGARTAAAAAGLAHSQSGTPAAQAERARTAGAAAGSAASQPRAPAAQAGNPNEGDAGSGTPAGKRQRCKCTSRHCRNEGQHDTATGSAPNQYHRPQCANFAADGWKYCSVCKCRHDGCPNIRYSCEMCKQHWHESEQFAPEWRIIVELNEFLAQMDPPDLQTFESKA